MSADSSEQDSRRTTQEIYEEYKDAVINTYNVVANIDPRQYTCAHLASKEGSDSTSDAVMWVKAMPIVEGEYMVQVRTLSGETTDLTVVGTDTIAEVKKKFGAALLARGQKPMKGVILSLENEPLDESRTLQSHGIGADTVIKAVVTEEAQKKEQVLEAQTTHRARAFGWKKSYGMLVGKEEGERRRQEAIEKAKLAKEVAEAKVDLKTDPRDPRKHERLIAALDAAAVALQGDDRGDDYKADAVLHRNTLARWPEKLARENEEAVLKKLKDFLTKDIEDQIIEYQNRTGVKIKSDIIASINMGLIKTKQAIEYSYMHFIKNHKYYYKSCERDTLNDKDEFPKMATYTEQYIEHINEANPWIKEYIDETIKRHSTLVDSKNERKKDLMIQEVTLYMACIMSAMSVRYLVFEKYIDRDYYKNTMLMPELEYYFDKLISEFDDLVDHENVATRVFAVDEDALVARKAARARALARVSPAQGDLPPPEGDDGGLDDDEEDDEPGGGGKRKRRTRRNKKYNKKSKKHHKKHSHKKHHKKRSYKKHHKKNHKKTHKKH